MLSLKAAMTRDNDLYFIHISDTNITPPRGELYTDGDTVHNFNRIIAAALSLMSIPPSLS